MSSPRIDADDAHSAKLAAERRTGSSAKTLRNAFIPISPFRRLPASLASAALRLPKPVVHRANSSPAGRPIRRNRTPENPPPGVSLSLPALPQDDRAPRAPLLHASANLV